MRILYFISMATIGWILAGCGQNVYSPSPYYPNSIYPPVISGDLTDPTSPLSDPATDPALADQTLTDPNLTDAENDQLDENATLPEQPFIINEPTDKTPVTQQTMVGAWTVSALDESCQIFLALTKWTGGFRAASRGCSSAVLTSISAWNVEDDSVILMDATGERSAILYRTGPARFEGATLRGFAISFSR